MRWFKSIQKSTNMTIICNFFASYHGYGACDAAASHVKMHMLWYQKDQRNFIQSLEDVETAIIDVDGNEANMKWGNTEA